MHRRLFRFVGPALGALTCSAPVLAARAVEWPAAVNDSPPKKLSRVETVSAMPKSLALKTQVFGNYENRLRRHSAPEKVFEYFASVNIDGTWFMTPDDFIRAITPYNPAIDDWNTVGSRNDKFSSRWPAPKLAGEALERLKLDVTAAKAGDASAIQRCVDALGLGASDSTPTAFKLVESRAIPSLRASGITLSDFYTLAKTAGVTLHASAGGVDESAVTFAALVDQDGDGLLSFGEYMFFLTILAIPSDRFTAAFRAMDEDGDGELSHDEFQQVMAAMRALHPQGRQVRDKNVLGASLGRLETGGQLEDFFGEDGTKKLSAKDFEKYVRKVQLAVREREFARCDYDGSGTLSPHEFAMYLLSFAPPESLTEFSARADALKTKKPATAAQQISKADFFTFSELLQHLDELQDRLNVITAGDSSTGVSQAAFTSAANTVLGKAGSPHLSPALISVVFALFDANGDGLLDQSEFMDVMREKATHGLDKKRGFNLKDKLSGLKSALTGK